MNEHEIQTWNIALERGDTDLFADIIDHSKSAHWLAMEQCLPISTSGPAHDEPNHNHIIDKPEKDLINSFRKRFSNRGWYEHDFKHGNVGKNSDGNTVLLDYGSFTEHKSIRND